MWYSKYLLPTMVTSLRIKVKFGKRYFFFKWAHPHFRLTYFIHTSPFPMSHYSTRVCENWKHTDHHPHVVPSYSYRDWFTAPQMINYSSTVSSNNLPGLRICVWRTSTGHEARGLERKGKERKGLICPDWYQRSNMMDISVFLRISIFHVHLSRRDSHNSNEQR